MTKTIVKGIKVKEFIITPNCQKIHGPQQALEIVLDGIREGYEETRDLGNNLNAKFHIVLTLERI